LATVNASAEPLHIGRLLWAAMQRARADGLEVAAAMPGLDPALSPSHLRLLDHVPEAGARVTDLATSTRITKQALGQLAGQLADRGFLETAPDPADGRAKLIRCTPKGAEARAQLRATAAALEDRWRAEVGAERYAVFRSVLVQLAGSTCTDPDCEIHIQ
jgi:DNA-binding MarR family transcriptional regulator